MKDLERRHLSNELRALDNEESSKKVEGYALKYDTPSEILHTPSGQPFIEVIRKGALDNADLSDVRMFQEHDSSKLLGRTTSKTLQLELTTEGLYVSCELPNNNLGNDMYESIRRQDLNQMSFQFAIDKSGQEWDYSGSIPVRNILAIRRITEVSAVSIPAYTDTELMIAQRSLDNSQRELALQKLQLQIAIEKLK